MDGSSLRDRFAGCLLGGAVGDALGWPIEFDELEDIKATHGPDGIRDLLSGENGLCEITDDTQLTLFTAEGVLRAWTTSRRKGAAPDFTAAFRRSYLCWLLTQGEQGVEPCPKEDAGWLLAVNRLHERRAPGNTCISALRGMDPAGERFAFNDSKGCGGVMRAAPAGLFAARISNGDTACAARLAFEIGCKAAAVTHGNPSGYYPAGILAAVITFIVNSQSIRQGVERSLVLLHDAPGAEETAAAVHSALDLAGDPKIAPSPEAVESLGEGWYGHEALAIGRYCALTAGDDFARGVRLAVNHSGDSDSTGSITGNILGAVLGEAAIPPHWLERLELRDVIQQVSSDLWSCYEETDDWQRRYPLVQT